jgi:glycosyltransferase involved in cell wall biosynthesis
MSTSEPPASVSGPVADGAGAGLWARFLGRGLTHARHGWLRVRAPWPGRLRSVRATAETLSLAYWVRSRLPWRALPARLLDLLRASRHTRNEQLRRLIGRDVAPYLAAPGAEIWRRERIGIERYRGLVKPSWNQLSCSLVLKEPGPNGEKGVLYSSFESNWTRLIEHFDAARFLSEYYLVGASSGSPIDCAPLAQFAGLSRDPVFIGISNPGDVPICRLYSPAVEPLEIMACDWVDPADYRPKPHAGRSIDILMVANWLAVKRHWLLFEALRDMPRNLRIVLVGRAGKGRTEQTIREEARAFGAPQDLEIYSEIPPAQVRDLQCDARISVLLSYREGSCVAPVESMFADTPVAMMRDAHIGSKAYVNEHTGVILERRGLARSLMAFLERGNSFRARQWALDHITCHHSTRKLNEQLRRHAGKTGAPWTRDIVPLCWRYVPCCTRAEDEPRIRAGAERLWREHGIQIPRPTYRKGMGTVWIAPGDPEW